MYRVAVVEDQQEHAERLQGLLQQYAEDRQLQITCDWWDRAEAFLEQYKHQYDVIFMDIRLPGMDGMKAAYKLRQVDHTVLLVFLTSLAQYAVEGYTVEALDYILKPITYDALRLKLPRILRRCSTEETEILIESGGSSVKVKPSELRYVEIFDHHIQYMTQSGIVRAYGTLKEIEDALPQGFFRVNNQTIVNLIHVTGVRNDDVLVDERTFSLSRRRRKEFMEALRSSGIRM